jgi:hypothetical protein
MKLDVQSRDPTNQTRVGRLKGDGLGHSENIGLQQS